MVITDITLNNSIWSAVKNRIVAGLTSDSITASVVPTYNDQTLSKPLVVVQPISKNKNTLKFGSTAGRYDVTVDMLIMSNNTLDVDTLSQAIENYLEADDIDGLSYLNHITSYSFSQVNDAPYHIKSISVSYVRE